ncbi:hypothetical protein KM176_11560 [Pseudooceanicola sp. CBS1P-1]|uniref:Uncharacterized protein n=1 Tax=Pseudooceanicola albus TaxID=2692189 RepID=A0A6L7GCS9_9RHOB|nr:MULTISPECIES: hypothetical protein [Pseudooceanicola]MBT9384497.1 hypothetical protein [Pseudooceanicola endophyticus]MXN20603.1 hypothetical protein [Pseudooceanicola albus]
MIQVYEGPAIRALFGQMVRDFGGVEAAAALLGCSKGTISKQCNDQMPIPTRHWAAMEDELGRWPITDMLADRRAGRGAKGILQERAAQVIAENGDVANAIFRLLGGGAVDLAVKELREAISASQDLLALLETEGRKDA